METNRYYRWATISFLLFAFLLASCQNNPVAESGSAPEASPGPSTGSEAEGVEPVDSEPDGDPIEEQASPETLWQSSPHYDTYVTDEQGNNSNCTRCHSPVNWVPAMDDMPESCYSCKFEIDPPPPMVPEKDWTNIQCNVCHQVKKKVVQEEIAWLEIPPIEEYSVVNSNTELCQKCHTDVDIPGHMPPLVAGVHQDKACTDCHDAHSVEASCGSADCHPNVLEASEEIPGHDANHQMVSCVACHDASGLDVGPGEDGQWVTFQPGEEQIPHISHNLALEAACERCHFPGNPWGLNEVVTDAAQP